MRVVVVGAGEVGTLVAESLLPSHDVVMVDRDPDRVQAVTFSLDVLAVEGDGSLLSTLQEAEVGEADLFVAATSDEMANLVACGTAQTLGEAFRIARVDQAEYLYTWQRSNTAFGVDHVVCSDLLTAENIVRVLGLPAALDVDPFVSGLVQAAEFRIDEGSRLVDETVAEADRYETLTFAGLFREGETLIPEGTTVLRAGDRVVVIGSQTAVREFSLDVVPPETPAAGRDVVVAGGSGVGFHVARILSNQGFSPRLVERDERRARWLAEELPGVQVLNHEATDGEFLERQQLGDAYALVACLGSDDQNLLASILGERIGTERVVAVVDNRTYVSIFEEVGVDAVVNPRRITAEQTTRFSYETVAQRITMLEGNRAQVLGLKLDADSALVGEPLHEVAERVEASFVVGAIVRGDQLVTPRGDTVLEAGDQVVVFAETPSVSEVAALA